MLYQILDKTDLQHQWYGKDKALLYQIVLNIFLLYNTGIRRATLLPPCNVKIKGVLNYIYYINIFMKEVTCRR